MTTKLYSVKVVATLYVSDHDGYCSGGECDLSEECVSAVVDVPKCYLQQAAASGTVPLHPVKVWEALLPKLTLNEGSYYCDLSARCVAKDLGQHDYRYEVQAVEVICREVALPADMPSRPRDELAHGSLMRSSALELLDWASRCGNDVALQLIRQHADLGDKDARTVISALSFAAASGHISVFDFWRREYHLRKEEINTWYGPLHWAVAEGQVALLQWFRETYKYTRKDLGGDMVVELLVTMNDNADVLRCFIHGFGVTKQDIRHAIYGVVKACIRAESKGGYFFSPETELGVLLDALTDNLK